MSKWSDIYSGWKNLLIPNEEVKDFIAALAEERLSFCKECPKNSTPGKVNFFSRCLDCGCHLQAKCHCLDCFCPLEKWDAVATPEQDIEIQRAIEDETAG